MMPIVLQVYCQLEVYEQQRRLGRAWRTLTAKHAFSFNPYRTDGVKLYMSRGKVIRVTRHGGTKLYCQVSTKLFGEYCNPDEGSDQVNAVALSAVPLEDPSGLVARDWYILSAEQVIDFFEVNSHLCSLYDKAEELPTLPRKSRRLGPSRPGLIFAAMIDEYVNTEMPYAGLDPTDAPNEANLS